MSSHGRTSLAGGAPFTKEQSTSNPDISSPVSESGILEVKLAGVPPPADGPLLEAKKKMLTENHTANQTVSSNFPLSGKDLEEAKPDEATFNEAKANEGKPDSKLEPTRIHLET
mmetsp:Transcript_1639/g.2146  ORF Transcript_1639/g.2146 Transcript_1639/m.2146 type:complete len:114 (+) Transcript_1639:904-1245(+)